MPVIYSLDSVHGCIKLLDIQTVKEPVMFVELVYDKRNFEGLPGANGIILGELTKRIHRVFPDADVRVKPMMSLPAINTDASKHEKERISAAVQEMFEEADMWLSED